MTTYNTGNPLGSSDPKDLYDNAQNLDEALNSPELTWVDRLGNLRPTFQGAVSDAITATELADPTGSSRIGHLPEGTGAVATTVDKPLNNFCLLDNYGAPLDLSDTTPAMLLALTDAVATGRTLLLPPRPIQFSTSCNFSFAGKLKIAFQPGSELIMAATPVSLNLNGSLVKTATLTAPIAFGDRIIQISDGTSVARGQLITFNTSTPVDTGFNYVKRMAMKVADVVGNAVTLSEPANFDFTIVETTLSFYNYATVEIEGLNVSQAVDGNRRMDLGTLQDIVINGADLTAFARQQGNVLFINFCDGFTMRDYRLINGVYPIQPSNGSRNLYFYDGVARSCRHPIDPSVWAYNVRVKGLKCYDTQDALQSHPAFEVYFEDVEDYSTNVGGGVGLRCIGGGIKNSKVFLPPGSSIIKSNQSPLLRPAYQYIGQLYDRTYENVVAPFAGLGGGDIRELKILGCQAGTISVDGNERVSKVTVDDRCSIVLTRASLRRANVYSATNGRHIESPPDTFASVNTIQDITTITQTNPAVVGIAAHGRVPGEIIRIDGVVGMTQINEKVYTVGAVTTDTFELAGVDATAYSAYVSGGKSTLGRLAKTIDPCLTSGLGIGNTPDFRASATVRNSNATLSPGTSVTIPVKIVNVFNIQEPIVRQAVLTIKALSSTDGYIVASYNLATFAGNAISAQQLVVPSISTLTLSVTNFRVHYGTQVTNEGGDPNNDAGLGELYYSFDIVVTANNTADKVQRVDIEVVELRANI